MELMAIKVNSVVLSSFMINVGKVNGAEQQIFILIPAISGGIPVAYVYCKINTVICTKMSYRLYAYVRAANMTSYVHNNSVGIGIILSLKIAVTYLMMTVINDGHIK